MDGSILVIEDDEATRSLLAANLGNAGYRVSCAKDVSEARALASQTRPDLLLLERIVNGHPALTYTRQLRGDPRTAGLAIIVIGTGPTQEQDTIAALESGADDYVAKPFSLNELLARIKAVMRRRAPQHDDEVVEIAGLRFDPAARRVSAWGHELELCTIEYRLLRFFMTHPDRLFSRGKLLDEVWGDHVCVEERTVDIHIRRLRQALESTGHSALVETVRGMGYRFRLEPPLPVPSSARAQADGAGLARNGDSALLHCVPPVVGVRRSQASLEHAAS